MFLEMVGKADNFPELQDTDWLANFVFGGHTGPSERSKHEAPGNWYFCA